VIKEIRDFHERGGGTLGWDHQAGCCSCDVRSFDTHGCFLLKLRRSSFRGCCEFGLTFLGLAVSMVAITIGFSGPRMTG